MSSNNFAGAFCIQTISTGGCLSVMNNAFWVEVDATSGLISNIWEFFNTPDIGLNCPSRSSESGWRQ